MNILLKPDPPVPTDGSCARPGCRKKRKAIVTLASATPDNHRFKAGVRKRKRPAGTNLAALTAALSDPFCSTTCCRIYHGVGLGTATTGMRAMQTCKGCGCPLNKLTPGCHNCSQRRSARLRTAEKSLQPSPSLRQPDSVDSA